MRKAPLKAGLFEWSAVHSDVRLLDGIDTQTSGENTRRMGLGESLRNKILWGIGGAAKWSERRFSQGQKENRREQNAVRDDVVSHRRFELRTP